MTKGKRRDLKVLRSDLTQAVRAAFERPPLPDPLERPETGRISQAARMSEAELFEAYGAVRGPYDVPSGPIPRKETQDDAAEDRRDVQREGHDPER